MQEAKTVNWKHVQYCKFNTNPHFSMLYGLVSRLSKVRLIGQRRDEGTQWYNVVYDKDYLIQFMIIRLLMPLGITNKQQFDELLNEAWDGYIAATQIINDADVAEQSSQLFAINEIGHGT